MSGCRCAVAEQIGNPESYARAHLRELIVDDVEWQVLFQCPETGILLKMLFPHSGYHGGGPPELMRTSIEEASDEFGWSPESAVQPRPRSAG